ncbi:hypothetical protein ACWD1Y_41100 [Streptomyces sp. NPDC002814]
MPLILPHASGGSTVRLGAVEGPVPYAGAGPLWLVAQFPAPL